MSNATATDDSIVYKGFRILPARTAGRYRILDPQGLPVVPLSLRIYASHDAAIEAIRAHARALREREADAFRGPETTTFAGKPPAEAAAPTSSRRIPGIEMKA